MDDVVVQDMAVVLIVDIEYLPMRNKKWRSMLHSTVNLATALTTWSPPLISGPGRQ
jgi:hypothetical protein